MTGLGFYEHIKAAGFADLEVIIDNDAKREELLGSSRPVRPPARATIWAAQPTWSRRRSTRSWKPRTIPNIIANGYVTEVRVGIGRKLKVHGTPWQRLRDTAKPGIAPELGEHNEAVGGVWATAPRNIKDLKARKGV